MAARQHASPSYFTQRSTPHAPQDLSDHDCIGLRLPTHGGLTGWEFTHQGRTVTTNVPGRRVFNNSALVLEASPAGHGLAWLPENVVGEYLQSGQLLEVMEGWSTTFLGYHRYYASRWPWREWWRYCVCPNLWRHNFYCGVSATANITASKLAKMKVGNGGPTISVVPRLRSSKVLPQWKGKPTNLR